MSYTILYGIKINNELICLKRYPNGMLSCLPAWLYFEQIYFNQLPNPVNPPLCWQLKKEDMKTSAEFFTLLSTLDGYTYKRENLPSMIALLKETQPAIPDLSRLQIFIDSKQFTDYDKFFITATSVANYEEFIDYYSVDGAVLKYLKVSKTWDLFTEYLK